MNVQFHFFSNILICNSSNKHITGSKIFFIYNFVFSLDQWALRQPDGGKLEACTVIEITSVHFTDNWKDVPCASDEASQYVCSKKPETGRLVSIFFSVQKCVFVLRW